MLRPEALEATPYEGFEHAPIYVTPLRGLCAWGVPESFKQLPTMVLAVGRFETL